MHAVVAGSQGKRAARKGDLAARMDTVIRAVHRDRAAGDQQRAAGFQALGADGNGCIGCRFTRCRFSGHARIVVCRVLAVLCRLFAARRFFRLAARCSGIGRSICTRIALCAVAVRRRLSVSAANAAGESAPVALTVRFRVYGAAARRDVQRTVRDLQGAFRLQAVLFGVHGHFTAVDGDPALAFSVFLVGLDAVAARSDVNRAAADAHAVLAAQTVVHRIDRDVAVRDDQFILAGNAALVVALYLQLAAAVDRQVAFHPNAGVCIVLCGIGFAVRQCVLRAFCQRQEHLIGGFDPDRRAVATGNACAGEHDLYPVLIARFHHNASVAQQPAQHIHTRLGDGHDVAADLCALAGDCAAAVGKRDAHGLALVPGARFIAVGIFGVKCRNLFRRVRDFDIFGAARRVFRPLYLLRLLRFCRLRFLCGLRGAARHRQGQRQRRCQRQEFLLCVFYHHKDLSFHHFIKNLITARLCCSPGGRG